MENTKTDLTIRLLLIGDQAVGKSSLLHRYVHDEFCLNMMGTAGVDLKKKIITIGNDIVKVMIYDTAGHDRFRIIAVNQYTGSQGILILYDVTDRKTFDDVNFWMSSIKDNADTSVEVVLIGNKIDLIDERAVTAEEGKEFGDKFGVPFIETSAKSAENVESAFLKIITKVYEKERIKPKAKTEVLDKKEKKKSKCC